MQGDQRQSKLLSYNILIIVSLLVSAASGLAACKPKLEENTLSFKSIEQKDWSGTGKLYEPRKPGMVIISSIGEIDSLKGLVTDESISQLQSLDYRRYFALAAFQGWKPGTNFGIQVNLISKSGNNVNVIAQLHEPEPNEASGAMETSPYHLVKVQKTGSWSQEITFNLFSGDKLVASLVHTIR